MSSTSIVKSTSPIKIRKVSKIRSKLRTLISEIGKAKVSYLLLAPYALIFTTFTIIPVITAIVLSFTDFNLLEMPQFIGFQNYIRLFVSDDVFLIAVRNTLFFAAITGPIGFLASFIVAWLLNDLPRWIRATLVVVFYSPSITGQVYFIWKVLFSGDANGYVNGILLKLGMLNEPIQWLQNPKTMMTVVIIAVLWMSLGAGFLSFLAGFKGVDNALYEAGRMDGIQNRVQELWFITLPSMKPMLMFGSIMAITNSFMACDVINDLVGYPSTDYAAHTVVAHLMDAGTIRFEMGYASSIATVLFVSMLWINRTVQRMLSKVGQ
ncbi:carbohydrate ABC transporter permease [Paenibacillus sp. BC26]|uniref:carbohydrate ABC transporter permease n=1 Tax=Paenibacillus sp. BC26 TaxID=1881032 RepID=UPI0008E32246|nr:sugar ABC transporter permease [Paenibacillus sp. BC26]SFS74119.1 multiple sugar transport system permease protein [Paenibacillus sp. BC26]